MAQKRLKPRVFTSEELKQDAAHVGYELEMLVYAAGLLEGGYASPEVILPNPLKRIALESFLLHFRNLRDFMCLAPLRGDNDLFASDFRGDREATSIIEQGQLLGHEDGIRLNRMLAH